jgi:hypothetical protein
LYYLKVGDFISSGGFKRMMRSNKRSAIKEDKSIGDVDWLCSTDAMKALKISACELMHRRERGELDYQKKGNAYFYKIKI